jgi:hypothetical protein
VSPAKAAASAGKGQITHSIRNSVLNVSLRVFIGSPAIAGRRDARDARDA